MTILKKEILNRTIRKWEHPKKHTSEEDKSENGQFWKEKFEKYLNNDTSEQDKSVKGQI